MSNQPIEEKWKEEFDKEFGTVSWMTDYDDCENANSQIKSFIENLLEQERKRMSDIERVLERHISWKPTEGHGSEEELGFQKGLMAEAKLIKKEILAIIHPAVEEMPQMKGTLEALDDTHTVKEEKLGCGCVKNTCKCDPMRHWPPVCCDKCPSLTKEEPTTPEKKRCGHKKWTLSKSTKRGTRKICNNCGKDWKNEWETPKLLPTSSYEVTCGRCEKHQEFKYVHGWDNLTDCESCFKEWRKEKGL